MTTITLEPKQIAGLHAIDDNEGVYGNLKIVDLADVEGTENELYYIVPDADAIDTTIEPDLIELTKDQDISRVYRNAISVMYAAVKTTTDAEIDLSLGIDLENDAMIIVLSIDGNIALAGSVEIN